MTPSAKSLRWVPAAGGLVAPLTSQANRALLVEYPPKVKVAVSNPEMVLERGAVVAVLLCFKLWRCPDQHRAPVHRTTTNAPLKQGWTATLNDGACRAPGQLKERKRQSGVLSNLTHELRSPFSRVIQSNVV